ncbi:glycoside-pentoside-hexuronide (GPH):cation symporter [Pantoea sp. B65]|uniref:glycoside-pentoside-hexuronide (GPH):cation symporter n=1 Tax=Pantoea sp. B65 TaxID=2813359 RepID=UPI0039B50CA7
MTNVTLTRYEKFGYGLGDAACNLVWSTIMLFMAYFYTDVFGLVPVHMGTMFLAVRALDAVFDIYIGAIADRTRSKNGQFRPWILWFAIPFGLVCMMTFYTPDLAYNGKLIYACISYTLLSFFYSTINVPYCAMVNNLSRSSAERVSLQSWRFAMSACGGLMVSVAALPLVAWLGKGNLQQGYFYSMMFISVLGIILLFFCYAATKEKYIAEPDVNRSTVGADLRILLKSREWLSLFVLNIVNLVAVIFKTGVIIYFCNYVINRPDLSSTFLTVALVSGLAGALLSASVFKNISKVKGFKICMLAEVVMLVALYFVPDNAIIAILALLILINFVQLLATPLQWAMLSDVVDIIELQSGKKLSGIVFSTNLFAIKLGIALGGALIGWLLAWNGYVGGVAQQSAAAAHTIRLLFTLYPAFLVLLLVVIIRYYRPDNDIAANLMKTH